MKDEICEEELTPRVIEYLKSIGFNISERHNLEASVSHLYCVSVRPSEGYFNYDFQPNRKAHGLVFSVPSSGNRIYVRATKEGKPLFFILRESARCEIEPCYSLELKCE